MSRLAIIGGTGLLSLNNLVVSRIENVTTPFGQPSAAVVVGELGDREVFFLARHGEKHTIPPHKINYRANIWALKNLGVEQVIAVAAVGGITPEMEPARVVVPDQVIDYTHSRCGTYFEDNLEEVIHVDFTYPYNKALRERIIAASLDLDLNAFEGGVYGATQGPRLESIAEINRMERDGCDIVGMTGMPEAALARELELGYACCAVVANWAAGRGGDEIITMDEIRKNLEIGMARIHAILERVLSR